MSPRVYLDWNATAPLRPEAQAAMTAALALVGNPSSVHAEGRAAHRAIEQAREQVAALVGGEARNVTFTSGGTEANMLALSAWSGGGSAGRCERLLVSAIEHPSVLAGGRFDRQATETIPPTADGVVDLAALHKLLAARPEERPLVSIMLANNETGVIQPVREAATLVHEAGGLLHVDAVQAAGRMAVDIEELGADLLTLSAHKLGGPKGAGALVRRDQALHTTPHLKGGGQERGLRAGTENVAGIAGFGAAAAAARLSLEAERDHMLRLRQRLETGLRAATPEVMIFGSVAERLPNTTLFAVPGMKAETAIIAFDLEGVAVSSGAACSSGKVQPSHVLAAMGTGPELSQAAVRVSLGPNTTEIDLERFQEAWLRVAGALLKRRQGIAA
jgi:cysteine desulfurase